MPFEADIVCLRQMFERFSSNSRQSILLAQEEAHALGNNYLGSEHLLLGLAANPDSSSAKAMAKLGVEIDLLREALISLVPDNGTESSAGGELPFTPHAKRVMEGALREALALGHDQIGSEHLLLGLLRDNEGLAPRVLQEVGIDPAQLREQVLSLMASQLSEDSGKATDPNRRAGRASSKKAKGLEKFARNLSEMARCGQLDPVIGRSEEIERTMQILVRRTKSNPVLIGEPGVGKTAVVEGLAQKLLEPGVPAMLADKEIYALDMGSLIAGTRYRGEFEERIKLIIKEATEQNVILFIDEIHTLVGAGDAEGSLDAASILKPALARGEILVIGATTLDEFSKYLERDSALERRFQRVLVEPPSVDETVLILTGLRQRYEDHHRVRISDQALKISAELSDRYIADRFLPDKAIDLMDEASSRLNLSRMGNNKKIIELRQSKEQAIEAQDFERAAEMRDQERQLQHEGQQRSDDLSDDRSKWPEVTEQQIAEVASMWTGVPLGQISSDESGQLIDLETNMAEKVIGQPEAISAVTRALKRSRAGLRDSHRPLGSFLFLGPTGVGKTETARVLAEELFGDPEAMIRLDMSEYMEQHSVSRLVGAPPGYVGHDEGGQLTEPVRRKPYCVLLLDEIEKAHPDVANVLLQLLEDGQVTDSQGRKVSFQNVIVIMTSNLGAKALIQEKSFGFSAQAERAESELRSEALDALKKHFRPELLNRIDETVVFHRLDQQQLGKIVHLMLTHLYKGLAEQGFILKISEAASAELVERGYDPTMGARPLRRAIQTNLEDPLADMLLSGSAKSGDTLMVEFDSGEFIITVAKPDPVLAETPLLV